MKVVFLTSAIDGVGGQRHVSATIYTRERYPVPIA